MYVVSTFYKFVRLSDFAELREPLRVYCLDQGLIGTILLAPEGINATVSGSREAVFALIEHLRADERFKGLETKESVAAEPPFGRLRVRLKKEIISIRDADADPNRHVGDYVSALEWNELISDPTVTVIDTRNNYEVAAGTFEGAIDPCLSSFGKFPEFVSENLDPAVHKKVAMFCTGGIRCEKASALLLSRGFDKVYHLQGGILKYLAQVPSDKNMFHGECFVFDGREGISATDFTP